MEEGLGDLLKECLRPVNERIEPYVERYVTPKWRKIQGKLDPLSSSPAQASSRRLSKGSAEEGPPPPASPPDVVEEEVAANGSTKWARKRPASAKYVVPEWAEQ